MKYFKTTNENVLYFFEEGNYYGFFEYKNGFWKRFDCESIPKDSVEIDEATFYRLLMNHTC